MDPWLFLPLGYLFSIIIETPILLIGLSPRHPFQRKLFAGIWLTACTYPIVVIVLPEVFDPRDDRFRYLLVSETFAPVAECFLFCLAFWEWKPGNGLRTIPALGGLPTQVPESGNDPSARWAFIRDMIAITLANLASFGLGEVLNYWGFWPKLFAE
jgi:hypothetical protein